MIHSHPKFFILNTGLGLDSPVQQTSDIKNVGTVKGQQALTTALVTENKDVEGAAGIDTAGPW